MIKFFLSLLLCIVVVNCNENQKNSTRNNRDSGFSQSFSGSPNSGKGGATATSYIHYNLGQSNSHGFKSAGSPQSGTNYKVLHSGWENIGPFGQGEHQQPSVSSNNFQIASSDSKSEKSQEVSLGVDVSKAQSFGDWQSLVFPKSESNYKLESAGNSGSFGSQYGSGLGFGNIEFGTHQFTKDGGDSEQYSGDASSDVHASIQVSGDNSEETKDHKFGQDSYDFGGISNSFGSFGGGQHGIVPFDFAKYFGGGSGDQSSGHFQEVFQKPQGNHFGRSPFSFGHHQPHFYESTKTIPFSEELKIPVNHPVKKPIFIPIPIKVPEPYVLKIPVPVRVEKTVQVPVEKEVKYTVEKPVPVKVVKKIHVPVSRPYPVPVPVYKTKYVHHTQEVYEGGKKNKHHYDD